MRLRRTHIVLLILLTLAGTALFYKLIKSVDKDIIEIDISIKSTGNINLQLFYGTIPQLHPDRSHTQVLHASQFYKNQQFLVPDISSTRFVRLDFGENPNIVMIETIRIVLKRTGGKDTIAIWKGAEIADLIHVINEAEISARSLDVIQFRTYGNDPYVFFDDTIHKTLEEVRSSGLRLEGGVLFAAFVCALFFAITTIYLLIYLKAPSFREFIRQGSFLVFGGGAIIFFVFLNNQITIIEDLPSKENRMLVSRPVITKDNFFDYPSLFTQYASDRFSFRNRLSFLYAYVKTILFSSSAMNREVLMGKDKWFFANEPGTISDLRNMTYVHEAEPHIIAENFRQRKIWLAERGIRFYVMVAPNKNRVYPEKMPDGYDPVPNIGVNKLDFYKVYLAEHAGIEILDPTDSLKQAKTRREVYYSSDTHWNLFGGFKGYQVLMDAIGQDFPALRPTLEQEFFVTSFYNNEGDLAKQAGLQDVFPRQEYAMFPIDTTRKLIHPQSSAIRLDFKDNPTVDGSTLKLLMFRDSYANYLIPFLNQHFKDATYIWSYEFTPALIEELKPDVVIFETLQRFLTFAFMSKNPESIKADNTDAAAD